nr:MAG TPA: hypothetical protein [Caudoviricetes sp.]
MLDCLSRYRAFKWHFCVWVELIYECMSVQVITRT